MKLGVGVAVLGGGGLGGGGDFGGGVGIGVVAFGDGTFETNFTIGLVGLVGARNFDAAIQVKWYSFPCTHSICQSGCTWQVFL